MAQGVARGESTTAIAKRFEKIGVSEGAAAKRLAGTMIGGAQNRITAKQLREEELAAAENPGYGNSLLKKGRKHGIITSNKQHFKRDIEKEQAIEKAIKSDKPAFEED